MMNIGVHSDSIPVDLILEILSRLPAKSILRFRCVTKLWKSMIHRPYFTELFLTISRAHPRLLFLIDQDGEWNFYSTPQPQNPYDRSSLIVSADFHMKFLGENFTSASALMCLSNSMKVSERVVFEKVHVIGNPNTRQFRKLPNLRMHHNSSSFLGFDPIGKKYKVLCVADSSSGNSEILTLGNGNMGWRKIQCHIPEAVYKPEGICINGILYYLTHRSNMMVIVCFDVRSEKFKLIDTKWTFAYWPDTLVNYQGKLCGITCSSYRRLCMWILNDVEKQEFSEYDYTLPENKLAERYTLLVQGVTSTGQIVLLSNIFYTVPFYVFYFSPERKTLHTIEIEGIGNYFLARSVRGVQIFVDHVEDLTFGVKENNQYFDHQAGRKE